MTLSQPCGRKSCPARRSAAPPRTASAPLYVTMSLSARARTSRSSTYGVNSGVARSGKVLRRILNLSNDTNAITDAVVAAAHAVGAERLIKSICDERLRFLQSLRTWPVFGVGWGRRVADVRSSALNLAADGRTTSSAHAL